MSDEINDTQRFQTLVYILTHHQNVVFKVIDEKIEYGFTRRVYQLNLKYYSATSGYDATKTFKDVSARKVIDDFIIFARPLQLLPAFQDDLSIVDIDNGSSPTDRKLQL